MSKLNEFIWRSTADYIVIDNRIEHKPDYQIDFVDGRPRIWLKANEKYKWTPFLVMHKSERFTSEEWEAYVTVICDTLNANWVKQKLEGAG